MRGQHERSRCSSVLPGGLLVDLLQKVLYVKWQSFVGYALEITGLNTRYINYDLGPSGSRPIRYNTPSTVSDELSHRATLDNSFLQG